MENIAQTLLFSFFGVIAKSVIYKDSSWGEIVGFPILITLIFLVLHSKISALSPEVIWGLSGIVGFFLPFFKDLLNGRKIAKIFTRAYKNTKEMKDSLIEEIDKEL